MASKAVWELYSAVAGLHLWALVSHVTTPGSGQTMVPFLCVVGVAGSSTGSDRLAERTTLQSQHGGVGQAMQCWVTAAA